MKPGDLVQCNIFNLAGSGGYGLVLSKSDISCTWNVLWSGYRDEITGAKAGACEAHETELVVSAATKQPQEGLE